MAEGSLFERMRAAAARVAAQARFVHIDDAGIAAAADSMPDNLAAAESDDPAHLCFDDPADTLAYVLCVDAVNFGSGWFPVLRKAEGRSGYFTIAGALRRHFETAGRFEAGDLASLEPADCTRLFDQDPGNPESEELMALFARALRDLGTRVRERAGGSFEGYVALAGASAERMALLLAEMPFYRDVARYGDLEVPLYKRAQITVADLAIAFRGEGAGRFEDIDSLTMFPDNLVPPRAALRGGAGLRPGAPRPHRCRPAARAGQPRGGRDPRRGPARRRAGRRGAPGARRARRRSPAPGPGPVVAWSVPGHQGPEPAPGPQYLLLSSGLAERLRAR